MRDRHQPQLPAPLHRVLPHLPHVQDHPHNNNRRRRELHTLPHRPQHHRQESHIPHLHLLAVRGFHQTATLLHPHSDQLLADPHPVQGEEAQARTERLRYLSGRCQFE